MHERVTSVTTAEDRAMASGGTSGGFTHYEWTVRGLEDEIRTSEAILDLGCGVGFFGAYLNERFGKKPHGVDVVRHEGFRESDHASFELQNLETLKASGRQYDLIFAIGLLEYLPSPRALVRTLPAALRAGGRVVITAPNPTSLRSIVALSMRGEFSAFREDSNPASISSILPVDACRMFREAGFRDVVIDYSGRGRPPLMHGARYQEVLPFLRGRLWSDDFRAIATKE